MAGPVRTRPPDPGARCRGAPVLARPRFAGGRRLVRVRAGRCPAARLPADRRPSTKDPRSQLERDKSGQKQMLVQATEIDYDYTNNRVAAVGNVQIYYGGSTLEADKVIYDQTTKRLHAEGNVRLTEADGKITYGEIMDLSDDYRDGFVDSLRLDTPEQTRMAAARAERTSGNYTVFHNGVYTACEPCKDDPKQAAAVAGQGRAHHPRPEREDDLFRGRPPRILRHADRLLALLLGARSDGQAQDRRAGADRLVELEIRRRARSPLLLGAGAGLRRHRRAHDHHQAGPADAGRIPPAPDQRRL